MVDCYTNCMDVRVADTHGDRHDSKRCLYCKPIASTKGCDNGLSSIHINYCALYDSHLTHRALGQLVQLPSDTLLTEMSEYWTQSPEDGNIVHNVRPNNGPTNTPLFHDSSPPYSGLITAGLTASLAHLESPG
jgi:hypothetical protein